MSDNREQPDAAPAPTPDVGALVLAAGGFAAALGAASCCALPMLLASLGLGGAWLVTVAWFAAPHRIALLVIATACLAGGGLLLWNRGRAAACMPGTSCSRPGVTALTTGMLAVAAVLAVLGFVYA